MPSKLKSAMRYDQLPQKLPRSGTNKTAKPVLSGRKHSSHMKSIEDMHDEVIRLKKSLVLHKNDYEILKAKSRRFEEENVKKSRLIEELMDQKASDESVRLLAEGGSASSSLVVTRLKHKVLKLEKQSYDKEQELVLIRSDIKTTDRLEMQAAMEIYFEEVTRLKEVIAAEKMKSDMMKMDLKSQPSKIETLREKILKLVAKNNALEEENFALRKDLDNALIDGGDHDNDSVGVTEDNEYGAMSRVGLINHIRYLKADETRKNREIEKTHHNKVETLESTISTMGDKNEVLAKENLELKEYCNLLQSHLNQQKVKISLLEQEINRLNADQSRKEVESPDEGSFQVVGAREHMSALDIQNTNEANLTVQSSRNDEEKTDDDVVMLQSALQGHLSRVDAVSRSDSYAAIRNSSFLPDTVQVQSILRGHISRHEHMLSDGEIKASQPLESGCTIPSQSIKEEATVYLQSVVRGHIERSSH